MDELPVPVSASVFPTAAAAAASFCKPVAIAKPMLRTTQLAEPSASSVRAKLFFVLLRIKNTQI